MPTYIWEKVCKRMYKLNTVLHYVSIGMKPYMLGIFSVLIKYNDIMYPNI